MTVFEPGPPRPPQEPDVLSWKSITLVTVGTIALTILLSVLAAVAVHHYRAYPPQLGAPASFPANSVLEHDLLADDNLGEGARRRAADRAQLESWGWVDREAEIVRIPIDDAIELVAREQP